LTTHDSFDPFAGELEGYSSEKFYTKSADSRGHYSYFKVGSGTEISFRIPEYLAAAASQIKEVCPILRTNYDIWRDAVVHYYQMRGEQLRGQLPPEWYDQLDKVTAMVELERVERIRQQDEEMLAKMEALLRGIVSEEDRYDTINACERAALTIQNSVLIRRASDLIDRYRR
jgi:hypothetical protein